MSAEAATTGAGTEAGAAEPARGAGAATLVLDRFEDDRRRGRVIGTVSTGGQVRRGVDAEGVLAIDHGALRIQPLIEPGWGRSGIAYGPVARGAGVTLSVFILNGSNLSRTYTLSSFPRQVWRWLDGAKVQPVWRQVLNWALHHRPRESFWRKLRQWWRHRAGARRPVDLWENLAVGFFAEERPRGPLTGGNAFVVRGVKDLDNGELCAGIGPAAGRGGAGGEGERLSVFRSFQNVPVHYVVALRERGAAYYVSGPPGARGLGGHPEMRPVAIDPWDVTSEVFAGVHQSVLGEIGFGVDTRVYGVKVERVAELEAWYGTAHAADRLTGEGPLSWGEVGGEWAVSGVERSGRGAVGDGVAMLAPGAASGLVHAVVEPREMGADEDGDDAGGAGGAGVGMEVSGRARVWLVLERRGARLEVREGEATRVLAKTDGPALRRGERAASVQLLDDGVEVAGYINGRLIGRGRVEGREGVAAGEVGFEVRGGWAVRDFEAHPRAVAMPPELVLGEPWWEEGTRVLLKDSFAGAKRVLEGHRPEIGEGAWERSFGEGVLEVTGSGAARVAADVKHPNPGRTIYTVPWGDPSFADVEVELTPPGTGRFQKHNARPCICFWQDPENYLLVCLWLDDSPLPASISSFFRRDGFEDIFDAVWTCIGPTRAAFGRPMKLRVVCDSRRYAVKVDGEPVLYRALTDVYPDWEKLTINRVGIGATWEWGNDTGTVFRDLVVRGR